MPCKKTHRLDNLSLLNGRFQFGVCAPKVIASPLYNTWLQTVPDLRLQRVLFVHVSQGAAKLQGFKDVKFAFIC